MYQCWTLDRSVQFVLWVALLLLKLKLLFLLWISISSIILNVDGNRSSEWVSEWIVIDWKMNQNQPQSSSSEGRADDDSALSDFLASLVDYTPTVSSLFTIFIFKFNFTCIHPLYADMCIHINYFFNLLF